MSLTSLPVTAADLLQLQLGIEMFQNPTEATAEAAAINAGTDTVYGYAVKLLASNISFSQVAMAVDSLMFGVTDNTTELTKLATQFLPLQVVTAVANGFNPTVYAAEALGLALSGGNGTSNAFATNFGSLSVSAFAQAVATATGVNANAIQQFVTNWINFYTANPTATQGLSVTLASYGAAFGDAVGVALVNPTAANLQTLVPNALIDIAEGSYVAGTPLGPQATHALLQGEFQLFSALSGPLVLNNVPNGATLVADGFGAGNKLSVSGPSGLADAFTMTATSVQGQDWGTMAFSGFENVTLAFTAGVGGFDLDLGTIFMVPNIGGGNTLNFTGNANVYVSVAFVAPFGTGAITLVGGGIINDTDTGVLHFGDTTAAKIVGTTGGGIIMSGIDTSFSGAQEFGSATGWNNLAGSIVQDAFTGGKGNVAPGGEGDIFLTVGGADTVNLASGHTANHIEIYGGDGTTTTAGGITVYNATANSITTSSNGLETAHTGFWGNTAAGSTNTPLVAFKNSGIDASVVTIDGFIAGSGATHDVIDLSVSAWVAGKNPAFNNNKNDGVYPSLGLQAVLINSPLHSLTGADTIFTGELQSGGSVVGAPANTDVILLGGNFAGAAAVASTLHLNPFGIWNTPFSTASQEPAFLVVHEIVVYNDTFNNAHIADLVWTDTVGHTWPFTYVSNSATITVAVSDMAILLGVNANSLTGANIHFVS
jgi:hypothetical protein